jgi:hypothetical protein
MVLGEVQEISNSIGQVYYRVALNQSAPFTVKVKNINHQEAGTMTLVCCGVDENGNAVTGAKKVRYKKDQNGILTMGNVQNDLATQSDPPMNGCSFDMLPVDNHIALMVTGTAVPKVIGWSLTVTPENSISLIYF